MSGLFSLLPQLVCAAPPASQNTGELPPGAFAQFGNHRFYHGPGIRRAIFSPDGKRIASVASYDGYRHVSDKVRQEYARTIIIWNAATGERLREIMSPDSDGDIAFTSDGKWLSVICRHKEVTS